MKPKIYTKTGDGGETSLIGKRISKDAQVLDVLGILDELNSAVGVLSSHLDDKSKNLIDKIHRVQNIIFSISSVIAGGKLEFSLETEIFRLEEEIDIWTEELPELANFILPGGSTGSSFAHLARTICRTSERIFVGYINTTEHRPVDYEEMRRFLNRLSDWLFSFARKLNKNSGNVDLIWNSRPDELKLI